MRCSPIAAYAPLLPLFLFMIGCGSDAQEGRAREELREVIAVTSPPAAYVAEIVLGAEALDLVGPADPAGGWSPSDDELRRLVTARQVLLMGHEFEPWAQRAGLPPSRTTVLGDNLATSAVLTSAMVTHTHGNGPSHSHGGAVPTTWTSPSLLRTLVHGAAESLTGILTLDPEGEAAAAEGAVERRRVFEEELGAYEAALSKLSAAADGRKLFAAAHGLEYIAAAANLDLAVMLLEIEESGKRNDHAAEQLEDAASVDGHGRVLIWPGKTDAAFAAIAREELGLVSVTFDLGASTWGAPHTSVLARLIASTEALTLHLSRNK